MKPNGDYPSVLLSIDIAVRELDSKLVLASAFAARGFRAVVAMKDAASAIGRTSEQIIWIGKGLVNPRQTDQLVDHLAARRSAAIFHQDEGAMHAINAWEENVLQKHFVDQIRERDIARVCTWGERQKEVIDAYAPEVANRVVVTGSPRFDLCLPSYAWVTGDATASIRERFGSFILVCTRFTAVAHSEGMDHPFRRKLSGDIWPQSIGHDRVAELWFSKWHRDVRDFAEMAMFTKELAAAYPNTTIILRPHPSESLAFYRHAFSSFPNVVVTREGSVLPWIRAADLVVHSNCTTGVEAVLAGRPVVNLLSAGPTRSATDVAVACEAGLTVGSVSEAIEQVDRVLGGAVPSYSWSPQARSMLNNLTTEAIPLMVRETLRVVGERRITVSEAILPWSLQLGRAARKIAPLSIRKAIRRIGTGTGLPSTKQEGSWRAALNTSYVEKLLEGCRSSGVGAGRIRALSELYLVIDP